ncbi:BgTH12-01310, partial [Blumeria graminis f. sp. triticale]
PAIPGYSIPTANSPPSLDLLTAVRYLKNLDLFLRSLVIVHAHEKSDDATGVTNAR